MAREEVPHDTIQQENIPVFAPRARAVIIPQIPRQQEEIPQQIVLSGDRLDLGDVAKPTFLLEVIKQAISYSQLEGQTDEQIWTRRSAIVARTIVMWFVPWASIPLRLGGTFLTYFLLNYPEASKQYGNILQLYGLLMGDITGSIAAGIQAAVGENSGGKTRRAAFSEAAGQNWDRVRHERNVKLFTASHEKEITEWREKIKQQYPDIEEEALQEAAIQIAMIKELERQHPEMIRAFQHALPDESYESILSMTQYELEAAAERKLKQGLLLLPEYGMTVVLMGILAYIFIQSLPLQLIGFASTLGFTFIMRTVLPHLHHGYEEARNALLIELRRKQMEKNQDAASVSAPTGR